MSLSLEVEKFTVVGEERVIEGGGEDSLLASGGGIGHASGERCGKGVEAWSRYSR